MGAITWQTSATYLKSMVAAARALGHLQRVEEKLSAPVREMIRQPAAQSWWSATLLIEFLEALGPEASREVSIRASRDGMGPLIRPLASVVLMLTKSPQQALLTRLGTFASAGVKGIESRFAANADGRGGAVTFTFPEPVPAVVAEVWSGFFDVGFSLARGGSVVKAAISDRTHRFDVAW